MDDVQARYLPEGDDGQSIEVDADTRCYFCGEVPKEDSGRLFMALATQDDEAGAGWVCHARCVDAQRHPKIGDWRA